MSNSSNVMIVGSIILMIMAVAMSQDLFLIVAPAFIVIELFIAFYFVFKDHNKRQRIKFNSVIERSVKE